MNEFLGVLILAACAGGLIAWSRLRRGNRLLRLERGGQPTTGRLCAKNAYTRKGQTTYTLIYEYSSDKGTHQRSVVVSQSEFDAAQEGASIEMVVLPTDPRVAATRERVGEAISAARARRGTTHRRWDD